MNVSIAETKVLAVGDDGERVESLTLKCVKCGVTVPDPVVELLADGSAVETDCPGCGAHLRIESAELDAIVETRFTPLP